MAAVLFGGRGGGNEGDAATFPFGKHKGKSYRDVMEEDAGYCTWVMKLDQPSGPLQEFVKFLRKKGFEPGAGGGGGGKGGGGYNNNKGGGKGAASAIAITTTAGRLAENIALVCELVGKEKFRVYAEASGGCAPPPFLPPQIWDAISSLPGAQVAKDRKSWQFPLCNYEDVVASLPGIGNVDPIPYWVRTMIDRARNSKMDDNVELDPFYVDGMLKYQKEGLEFGIRHHGRCLLGDEMGLGKTLQALALAAQYMEDWPVLVICPSSLRWVWSEQILQWLPNLVSKDEVQVIRKGSDQMKPEAKFWIISYALLGTNARKDKFTTTPKGGPFGVVIADECHNIKEWQAERTKAVVPLLRGAKRAFLLSGTPTRNSAQELHPQLCGLLPGGCPAKFGEFRARYCIQQQMAFGGRTASKVVGARNAIELYYLLTSTAMVRRLKKEVLSQLPTLRRQRVPMMVEDKRAMKDIYADMSDAIGPSESGSMPVAWQSLADAKLKPVREYMEDVLQRGDDKIIVFAHHKSMMDGLADLFKKQLGTPGQAFIRIDGSTPGNKRHEYVKLFQEDFNCRVALLSITACGEGLTLTAAGLVIFAELYWVPGAIEQAEARAHRIGSTHQRVIVEYLVVPNSPDDAIYWSIHRKKKDTSTMLNGAEESLNVNHDCVRSKKRPAPTAADIDGQRAKASRLFAAARMAATPASGVSPINPAPAAAAPPAMTQLAADPAKKPPSPAKQQPRRESIDLAPAAAAAPAKTQPIVDPAKKPPSPAKQQPSKEPIDLAPSSPTPATQQPSREPIDLESDVAPISPSKQSPSSQPSATVAAEKPATSPGKENINTSSPAVVASGTDSPKTPLPKGSGEKPCETSSQKEGAGQQDSTAKTAPPPQKVQRTSTQQAKIDFLLRAARAGSQDRFRKNC